MNNYLKYSNSQLLEEIKKSGETLRNHLIRILWNRKDSKFYIRDLLMSTKPKIRSSVLRLMPSIKVTSQLPVLIKLLEEEELKNRRIIVDKLDGVKNPQAITALLSCIKNEHEDPLLKKKAITVLGNTADESVVGDLIKHFEQVDNDSKINILVAFSKLGSSKSVPLLRKSLYHPDPTIRLWTLKALKSFPEYLDYEEIIEIFKLEKNLDNKVSAISLLSRIKRQEVLDFLINLFLENEESSIKYDLLKSFEKFDPKRVISILQEKRKEAVKKNTMKIINEALEYLRDAIPMELINEKSIYRTWIRDPLTYPDTSEISFFHNGKGVYKEIKAGKIELKRFFRFVIQNESILFLSEKDHDLSTGFKIDDGIFNLPYERGVPCLIFKFSNRAIYLDGINISGTSYYFLKETL